MVVGRTRQPGPKCRDRSTALRRDSWDARRLARDIEYKRLAARMDAHKRDPARWSREEDRHTERSHSRTPGDPSLKQAIPTTAAPRLRIRVCKVALMGASNGHPQPIYNN